VNPFDVAVEIGSGPRRASADLTLEMFQLFVNLVNVILESALFFVPLGTFVTFKRLLVNVEFFVNLSGMTLEPGLVCKGPVTSDTWMRSFFLVNNHRMNIQITSSSKRFWADLTLEGLDLLVNAVEMTPQILRCYKTSRTEITFVVLAAFALVHRLDMLFEVSHLTERFLANLTLVWLELFMDIRDVLLQVLIQFERCRANAALEVPQVQVSLCDMSLQVPTVLEAQRTDGALESFRILTIGFLISWIWT